MKWKLKFFIFSRNIMLLRDQMDMWSGEWESLNLIYYCNNTGPVEVEI